jgi:ATP-dependent protease Clp ATPase subunit
VKKKVETKKTVLKHWCDFCGKSAEDVFSMVASDNADICDECIMEAYNLVFNQRAHEQES